MRHGTEFSRIPNFREAIPKLRLIVCDGVSGLRPRLREMPTRCPLLYIEKLVRVQQDVAKIG